jgi:hypothetical protein
MGETYLQRFLNPGHTREAMAGLGELAGIEVASV